MRNSVRFANVMSSKKEEMIVFRFEGEEILYCNRIDSA